MSALFPAPPAETAERSWGTPDYVKGLRQTLDANGFQSTQIIAADGGIPQDELTALQTDTEFRDAVFGLGA
jgi:nicotinic acid phosphoribosyltransferase